jgi:predicted permease
MRTIKFAFRTLFRQPFVTTVAIISLAFGIGANSAIFSLFDQMLLRPLPVTKPTELVDLAVPGPKPGSQSCNQAGDCDAVFSYAMFRDIETDNNGVFSGVAAHRAFGTNLAYKGQTSSSEGMFVSGSYFPTLGLNPALGRLIDFGDDKIIGDQHVAVLSHHYWQTRFGGSPNVLNDTMIINGVSMTIVGVAPKGFEGTTLGSRPEVFVPITMRGVLEAPFKEFDNRRTYWIYAFARLKPGITIETARTRLNSRYHAIVNEVEAPLQNGMSAAKLEEFRAKLIAVTPGARGQSSIHEEAKAPLAMLFGVTGVVLLIACANIANLLLARSAARKGEMALRLSIGASRGQLIRQLLVESCLLAVLGGLAGLIVAKATLSLIWSMLPSDASSTLAFTIEPSIMLFAGALSILTGLLFGLFPALQTTRPDLAATLKGFSGQSSGTRSAAWFRNSLVTTQITLSTALLICAGLFAKSLIHVSKVDLGVKIDNLITFSVSPRLNGYSPEKSLVFFERAEEELAAVPGTLSVTTALVPLLAGSNWGTSVNVEGFKSGPDIDNGSRFNEVGPGYFKTTGSPLLAGREFARSDAKDAAKVAIVNEAFAAKFNLGRQAVGKLMAVDGGEKLDTTIVGLVKNAKYSEVKGEIPPLFFSPYMQDKSLGQMSFYVRTGLANGPAMREIERVIASLDRDLPIENLRTMTDQVKQNVFLDRMISTLSTAFALLATVLAAIGLYGVLAYTVAQRTREFGLRMALGAEPGRVRLMVMKQVAAMTIIGVSIGAGLTYYYFGRVADSLLFQMQSRDPIVLVSSIAILSAIALLAGLLPAMRASRIDPMRALRYE